jgi:oligopeptide transport system ATP-binding protein
LQKTHNLSYIFISHDLSVIKAISDYVIVMRNGKIVEEGETDAIFERPAAEYTRTLIKSAFSAEVTS